jgi:hypothetical protein
MNTVPADFYLHAVEIALLVVAPIGTAFLNGIVLRRIMRDFPPHRHNNDGTVTYPKGYEPPREQPLFSSAKAGR